MQLPQEESNKRVAQEKEDKTKPDEKNQGVLK